MTKAQLADAMLKGRSAPFIRESRSKYIEVDYSRDICFACALGCAFIGMLNGDPYEARAIFVKENSEASEDFLAHWTLARLLGISKDLASEIENRHLLGCSIEEIASWLKGESK